MTERIVLTLETITKVYRRGSIPVFREELPYEPVMKRLGSSEAHRVAIEDIRRESGHPFGRYAVTFTRVPQGIECLATFTPSMKDRPSGHTDRAVEHFYKRLGMIQHYYVPDCLMLTHRRVAEFLDLSNRIPDHTKAYQPDGPWEYLPPDHARDWRSKARWVIPANSDVPLVKLALHAKTCMYRARVTIDHTPAKTRL